MSQTVRFQNDVWEELGGKRGVHQIKSQAVQILAINGEGGGKDRLEGIPEGPRVVAVSELERQV